MESKEPIQYTEPSQEEKRAEALKAGVPDFLVDYLLGLTPSQKDLVWLYFDGGIGESDKLISLVGRADGHSNAYAAKEEEDNTLSNGGRPVLWKGDWYDPPTMGQLIEWTEDGICETPEGDITEPDGEGSWLILLGLI